MTSQLYLHVGHGKTGSSFIQSSLAKSTKLLNKNKIYYPIREESRISASLGNISSGNGGLLLDSNFIHALIQRNIKTSLLFSSEFLINQILCNINNIQHNILELVDKLKIGHINILLFIRNPPELISSIYQQQVKRSGFYQDIQHLEKVYLDFFTNILRFITFIKTWQNTTLTILNYSKAKNHLLHEFEKWLALNDTLLTPDITLVNRSLTLSELELQKVLNKALGSAGSFLADNLCQKLPYINSDSFSFTYNDKQSFIEKINPIVNNINEHIPNQHHLDLTQWPDHINTIFYTFTKAQLEVIVESFADIVLKEKEKKESYIISHPNIQVNLNNRSKLLQTLDSFYFSTSYRIAQRLTFFPKIKNALKKVILLIIKFIHKTKLGIFTSFP